MSEKKNAPEALPIRVSDRGEISVSATDILQSRRGREAIRKMKELAAKYARSQAEQPARNTLRESGDSPHSS